MCIQPDPEFEPIHSIVCFWKVGKRTGCTWSITLSVVTECSLNRNREQTSCCFCRGFDMNWVQNEFAATNQVLNLLLHVINRSQNKFATTNRVLNLLHVLIAENTVVKQKHGLKKQLDIPQTLSHISSRAEPLYLLHFFFLACFHLRRVNFFWPKKRSVLQRDRDIGVQFANSVGKGFPRAISEKMWYLILRHYTTLTWNNAFCSSPRAFVQRCRERFRASPGILWRFWCGL